MNTIVFHIWSEFFAMGKDIKNRSAFNGTDVFAVSEMLGFNSWVLIGG